MLSGETLLENPAECDALRLKYHDLYDFAPVAYLTLNTMGNILEANLEATKMLGLNRVKLVNHRLQEFFDASALPAVNKFFRICLTACRRCRQSHYGC